MVEPFHVLTLNNIAQVGLGRFPAAQYAVGARVANPDAILVRSQDMHTLDISPRVRAIGRAGAGTNNIPVKQMSARGVPVFNAAGANANAVKELIVTGMLLTSRNILPALNFTAGLSGDDAALHTQVEAGKANYAGIELRGRTLGIIGLGAIGKSTGAACW